MVMRSGQSGPRLGFLATCGNQSRRAQGGDLVGVGEQPRHIVETGGEADGAVGDPLRDETLHADELVGRRRTPHRPHDLVPDGPRRHQVGDTQRDPPVVPGQEIPDPRTAIGGMAAVDGREVLAREAPVPGGEGDAVLPADHGGDALAQQRELHLRVEDGGVGVRVRVDEPGDDEPTIGLDRRRVVRWRRQAARGSRRTIRAGQRAIRAGQRAIRGPPAVVAGRTHLGDPVPLDQDVGPDGLLPITGHDDTAADEQSGHRRVPPGTGRGGRGVSEAGAGRAAPVLTLMVGPAWARLAAAVPGKTPDEIPGKVRAVLTRPASS